MNPNGYDIILEVVRDTAEKIDVYIESFPQICALNRDRHYPDVGFIQSLKEVKRCLEKVLEPFEDNGVKRIGKRPTCPMFSDLVQKKENLKELNDDIPMDRDTDYALKADLSNALRAFETAKDSFQEMKKEIG